jgi:hypothetical protein
VWIRFKQGASRGGNGRKSGLPRALPRGFRRFGRRRRAQSSGERASPSSFPDHFLESFLGRRLLPRAPLPPGRARPTTEAMREAIRETAADLLALRDGNVCISWILQMCEGELPETV